MAVKLLFPELLEDSELMSYFDTDLASKGKFPERTFFWGVMHAVRKDFTQALLNDMADRRLKLDEHNSN